MTGETIVELPKPRNDNPKVVITAVNPGDTPAISGRVITSEPAKALRASPKEQTAVFATLIAALPDGSELRRTHARFVSEFQAQVDLSTCDIQDFRFEVLLSDDWETISEVDFEFPRNRVLRDFENDGLTKFWAEHNALMADKHELYFESESKEGCETSENNPRVIAFYSTVERTKSANSGTLPEKDSCWETIIAAPPRFVGHNQPNIPIGAGFYDTQKDSVIADQIELAKRHGVRGFCFQVDVLPTGVVIPAPLDNLLADKRIDFEFMIQLNFVQPDSRGKEASSEINGPVPPAKSITAGIDEVLGDSRYARIDKRPALVVSGSYKPTEQLISFLQEDLKTKTSSDPYLIYAAKSEEEFVNAKGFDGVLRLEPHFTLSQLVKQNEIEDQFDIEGLTTKKLEGFRGISLSYRKLVSAALNEEIEIKQNRQFRSVAPSWDESTLFGAESVVTYGSNPNRFYRWLKETLNRELAENEHPLVFLNSWNDWAHGSALEPSVQFGHAYLNSVSRALCGDQQNTSILGNNESLSVPQRTNKLAVVLHAFYTDRLDYIEEKLNLINQPFDLFISTQKPFVDFVQKKFPEATVFSFVNRGRDVFPFVFLAPKLFEAGYETVLKIHTKKSLKHNPRGEAWFEDIIEGLLPNAKVVAEIEKVFASKKAAFAGPAGHYVSLKRLMLSEGRITIPLFRQLGTIREPSHRDSFFVGTMFWANLEAITPILDFDFAEGDFPVEKGQIRKTLAHALERLFSVPAQQDETLGRIYLISEDGIGERPTGDAPTIYKWVNSTKFPEGTKSAKKRLFEKPKSYLTRLSRRTRRELLKFEKNLK